MTESAPFSDSHNHLSEILLSAGKYMVKSLIIYGDSMLMRADREVVEAQVPNILNRHEIRNVKSYLNTPEFDQELVALIKNPPQL